MWLSCLWALGCGAPAPAPASAPAPAPVPSPPPPPPSPEALAIDRAIGWLVHAYDDPDLPLNLETPIALVPLAGRVHDPRLDALVARLLPLTDRPGDPRRRAYDPSARLPEAPATWWEAAPGAKVHPSQVFVEVLYCPEHGLRPSTIRWMCDTFRDHAGPSSAHSAWYLALAVDAGCVPRADTCLDALVTELVDGSTTEPPPTGTTAIDRLAEQVLFGRMGGASREQLAVGVDRLLGAQRPDGAFAAIDDTATDRDAARGRVHATLVSVWALSLALPDQQPSSSVDSPEAPAAPGPPPPGPPAPSENDTPSVVNDEPPRQTTPIDAPPAPPPP